MKSPANIAYLTERRTKLKYFVQSQSGNVDAAERENYQRIMREEWFGPGYSTDLWCSSCVYNMVKILQQKFEEWMVAKEAANAELDALMKEGEVLTNVIASFPKHDSDRRVNSNTFIDTKGAGTEDDIKKRESKRKRK
jgi:glucose-6-phosphate isomerase